MLLRRLLPLALTILLTGLATADDFLPYTAQDLAMKEFPGAPGAHAVILNWTTETNDVDSREERNYQIKILTEEGKKYADIEIPYFKGPFRIDGVKARTIKPDGTIVPFTGKVFDKMIVKARGVKYQAKTFTLPDVQPGSIIEYRYVLSWDPNSLINSHWELQRELFVRRATFRIKPYTDGPFTLYWMVQKMGDNKRELQRNKAGYHELVLENIPAFGGGRLCPAGGGAEAARGFLLRGAGPEQC